MEVNEKREVRKQKYQFRSCKTDIGILERIKEKKSQNYQECFLDLMFMKSQI